MRELLSVCVLTAFIGVRGLLIAHMMDGRYALSTFAKDAAGVLVLVAGFRLLAWILERGARAIVGSRGPVLRGIARVVVVLLVIVIALPFLLVTMQLHPQRVSCRGTPADQQIAYRDVALTTDDGVAIAAWFIPASRPASATAIVVHGIGANKENFLDCALAARSVGYDVLTIDMRGHGESGGWTSALGATEWRDVKAAYDWTLREFPGRPVFAMGYSMGGAAVVRAAVNGCRFDRIVLDSTFARLEDVARASVLAPAGPLATPLFAIGRVWGLVWTGADIAADQSIDLAPRLAPTPVLLVHSKGDGAIPWEQSVLLSKAIGPSARLWIVDGVDHCGASDRGDYARTIGRFLAGLPEKTDDVE